MAHPDNLTWRLRGVVAERVAALGTDQRRMLDALGLEPDLLAPLGRERSEVHYTQALAWAMDKERSDSLGPTLTESFLDLLHANGAGHRRALNRLRSSPLERVTAEHILPTGRRVDLALRFEAGWLFVENKVDSTENNGQLKAYRKHLDKLASKEDLTCVLAYLTANEDDEPPGKVNALHITWEQLLGAWLPLSVERDSHQHRYLRSFLASVARHVVDVADDGAFEDWAVGYQHSALDFLTRVS
jgi:hypothetical protein